jgi:hypothetical protein
MKSLEKIPNFPKELLTEYCNTREKKFRTKDINYDTLRQTLYSVSDIFKNDFNCIPYFITVTFPKKQNLEDEWIYAGEFIDNFKQKIPEFFLVVGGIIAVEPHKNSSLKKKNSKNTKAGRPHFHMVLWFCHPFFNPSMEKLKLAMLKLGTITQIKKLETNLDVLKSGLYTTKEKGNITVKQIAQQFIGWESNINIWVNQKETTACFQLIAQSFNTNQVFTSYENYMMFPTSRKHPSDALILTEIFSKIFKIKGLAVKDQKVYRKIEGTLFSWEPWISLEQWISNAFDLNAPPTYLEMLKENALWISKQGGVRKVSPKFELFPQLIIQLFYVEFKDVVYEFSRGTTMPLQSVASETATVCYVDRIFDQIEPPFTLLGLVQTLIAWGKDITQEKAKLLLIPEQERDRYNEGCLQHIKESESRFHKALTTFGGLYHPEINRKTNPALYLTGEPSTFKTFILLTIFKQLIGIDHIDILSRHNTRFNFANLKKQHNLPYVLLLDDFRWQIPGMHIPDFLNLLDGNFVSTEQKFQERSSGSIKGTVAITSNERLTNETNLNDYKALETRINQIYFHPIKEPKIKFDTQFYEQIEKESIGFSILTNALFLASNPLIKKDLRIPKSFFDSPNIEPNTSPFKYAGVQSIKLILPLLSN